MVTLHKETNSVTDHFNVPVVGAPVGFPVGESTEDFVGEALGLAVNGEVVGFVVEPSIGLVVVSKTVVGESVG